MTLRPRPAIVLPLVLAAPALALALRPVQDDAPAPPGTLERFVEHEGRPAHLSFDPTTRRLVVVGEADRPFVFREEPQETTSMWWTTVGDLGNAPALEYLLREQARRAADDPERRVLELPDRFTPGEGRALIPMALGTRVTARVNANAGDLDVDDPTHFRPLASVRGIRPYLLVGPEGSLDVVIPETSLEGRWFEGEAEGDGSAERSGGLRLDLVLHGELDLLPPETMLWLGAIDAGSPPYELYRSELPY